MTTRSPDGDVAASDLSRGVVLFMAVAAAVGTAAIYPLQPALTDVAASLGTSQGAVGLALACGPAGYLVGLALLVPLVDQLAPRDVLTAQIAALGVLLAVTAAVQNTAVLGACLLLSGVCSSVGAGLSSVASRLAGSGRRATVLGVVTAGISAGILIGRIAGGWLTDVLGWREMLVVCATMCLGTAALAGILLPRTRATHEIDYLDTLRSMPGLLVRCTPLRLAAARGAAWFFAFCAVWAGLAVALSEPPFSYSSEQIGLYALAGLSGLASTRFAGVLTDRFGARAVILGSLGVAGVAAVALGHSLGDPASAVFFLALFDAGLFAAQVANQSTVVGIDPQAPARYNSAYMVTYFVGGSAGTAFGAAAVGWIGWPGTAAAACTLIAAAATISFLERSLTDER